MDAELAAVLVGVGDTVGVVGPERVPVTAVVAGRAGSAPDDFGGSGEHASEGRYCCEDVGERDHCG